MEKKELLKLVQDMTITEKAMQMTQLVAGLICHTQVANLTGPFREWSFTDEELKLALIDGVNMNYYLNTKKIEIDGVICEKVKKIEHEDGSIEYINDPEDIVKIPSTSVIIAVGQGALNNIVKTTIDTYFFILTP